MFEVGNRREIFADGAMAETLEGARLMLHEPKCEGTAFAFSAPWEGETCAYCTVAQQGKRALLYYRGSNFLTDDLSEEQVTCLAQSEDGVTFVREPLGVFEKPEGNNIILRGENSHNFTPFYDNNPACAPDARFKAVAGLPTDRAGNPMGLFAYASPDGVHWHTMQDTPVITDGLFDSQNVAFYDAVAGVYRCYVRYWDVDGCATQYQGLRAIQSCTSTDFIHWTKMRVNEYGEPREEQFYTNATVPCPGAEHILLSFPKRFNPTRKKLAEREDSGISEAVFMASRDGVNWPRLFKQAWIRPGADIRNWGDRSRMTARGLYEHEDGTLSIYVSANYRFDTNRLERFTIRPQGFVSLHADWDEGSAVTPLMRLGRGDVHLNVSTSAAGSVRVEVLDAQGRTIPGYEPETAYYGDEYDFVYPFAKPLAFDEPVRLKFYLKDADVYAFQVR